MKIRDAINKIIQHYMRYKFTDEDILFLKQYYPCCNWDKIFERFPFCSKSSIHHKMSRLGVRCINKRMNSTQSSKQRWSKEEDNIIKNMYSKYPIEVLIKKLNGRSANAIKLRGSKLGITSFSKLNITWTKEQEQYIIDNWELEPDKIMALKLNKTFRSIKWKRECMGLYRRDVTRNTYPTISKYLRGQNQNWKLDSMKDCKYQCVLTQSKDFEIHHLYSVSNIINDIFQNNCDLYKENFSDYSDKDLYFILQKFKEIQNSYPLGVCVDKKLHILFHSLYGQYYNTPEQWYKFADDYKKGVYKNIIDC